MLNSISVPEDSQKFQKIPAQSSWAPLNPASPEAADVSAFRTWSRFFHLRRICILRLFIFFLNLEMFYIDSTICNFLFHPGPMAMEQKPK